MSEELDILDDSAKERPEGQIGEGDALSLDIDDTTLVSMLDRKISDSQEFWNGGDRELDKKRKDAQDYWIGRHYNPEKDGELQDWQTPYVDNRIFVSTETIIPVALSKPAQPVVIPAKDTEESRKIAKYLEEWLFAKYKDLNVRNKQRMSLRHLVLYRLGCLKVRWDRNIGENGDIVIEWVRPQKLIIDKNAKPGGNPSFIAEYVSGSVEEIVAKYPDAKDHLLSKLRISESDPKSMGKSIGYQEIWFTFYEGGKPKEGLLWKYEDVILDKSLNPYWNYEGEKDYFPNHFQNPKKPYCFSNYLNLGRYFVDDTSLVDQALPQQDILNKRGRQIVENADAANSGLVFDDKFLDKTEVSQLTGAFDERIIGHGDVRAGVTRLAPPLLPNYVLEDKYDARREIDNIFGTHNPTRGEESAQPTLGQDLLARQGDFGRIDDLVQTAVEPQAQELYNWMVQLMKVFYKEEHMVKNVGKDNQVSFMKIKRDKIEDGVEVKVVAGTTLPNDKISLRNEAIELAKTGQIDPLSFFEDLNKPNPKERAKRLILYQADRGAYLSEFIEDEKKDTKEGEAKENLNKILGGEFVEPPKKPSQQYARIFNEFVKSANFAQLQQEQPEVAGMVVQHMRGLVDNAAKSQVPAPEGGGEIA